MDDIIMAGKVTARLIAPEGPNSVWMDLEAAHTEGYHAGLTFARTQRDLQLDTDRAQAKRLENDNERLALDVQYYRDLCERISGRVA